MASLSKFHSLFNNAPGDLSRARISADSVKESGAWLRALPISNLGLHNALVPNPLPLLKTKAGSLRTTINIHILSNACQWLYKGGMLHEAECTLTVDGIAMAISRMVSSHFLWKKPYKCWDTVSQLCRLRLKLKKKMILFSSARHSFLLYNNLHFEFEDFSNALNTYYKKSDFGTKN